MNSGTELKSTVHLQTACIPKKMKYLFLAGFFLFCAGLFTACSFDYGTAGESDKSRPDIVMENLEYVRVRGGDPLMRIKAAHGERWEDSQLMDLTDTSFEQMEDQGESVNAKGHAGEVAVHLDSGDISLKSGVSLRVNSEDITISTTGLEWKDKDKTLTGGDNAEVDIQKSDGTSFTGVGFFSDARNRTWSFTGKVQGTYVENNDSEKGTPGNTGAAGEQGAETEQGNAAEQNTATEQGAGQSTAAPHEAGSLNKPAADKTIPGATQVLPGTKQTSAGSDLNRPDLSEDK
ncbi:MAG: LPS export ABC transporter periplasmic protein LptC [Treponema sp.]|nr:LPS export ABC transporter periplasmic protein LptC [Treponema sp.]